MTDTTARLAIPLLHVGQAQKEIAHNEALAIADLAIAPAVMGVLGAPPAEPVAGQAWIVGPTAAGAWTGQAGAIAGWTAGGWRFVPATDGMTAWVVPAGVEMRRVAGAWRQGAAVAVPAGGSVVDGEARAGLSAVISVLRAHGLIAA